MLIFENNADAMPLELVDTEGLASWLEQRDPATRTWLQRADFTAKENQAVTIPGPDGAPGRVIAGIGSAPALSSIGSLPRKLPAGDYSLATEHAQIVLGWGLGAYRFDNYRSSPDPAARLFVGPEHQDLDAEVTAVSLCRDLINTPTSDMLPHDLEGAARKLAIKHNAQIEVTTGDALLTARYNVIHAVGRASASAPRLIDIRWGDPDAAKVTLVGKGVCFDSGGLDLKSASNMRTMKKDMGGAATVLGLADLIMARSLPVRLRVLVPAVENAVAGNAYRPGDVLHSYKGITVEIENTDAEGRLILCDALALAAEETPDLIIDYATLTGAARSALGTELPAMFSTSDDVANGIVSAGTDVDDAVWRMPLHRDYRSFLDSKIADVVNSASTPYGGAITAALFMQEFVADIPWVHFDIMGWNLRARPARPEGGEAMALRAVFRYLADRFG